MANTNPNVPAVLAPAAAPAAAAPAAPQAAQAVPASTTETFKVDGIDMALTPAQVRERVQKSLAVDRRLEEVATMRRSLQEQQQAHQDKIAFADRAYGLLAQDPDKLVEEVARMARLAKGGDVKVPSNAGAEALLEHSEGTGQQPQGQRGASPELVAQLRELQGEIRQLKSQSSVDRLGREIGEQLDQIPLYTDRNSEVSVEARGQAELLLRALRSSPDTANVPMADLVSQVHARIEKLVSQKAQASYDARTQTAAAVPAVPAQAGSPALTGDKPEEPKAAWMRNGGKQARSFLEQAWAQFQRGAVPSR